MVLLQEVYRYPLRPVEVRLRKMESSPGVKGKLARVFRIGMAPRGHFESFIKFMNQFYMAMMMFTQKPWGPVYKRLFEFDMAPGRGLFLFCRHRWIFGLWAGNYFMMEDENSENMMQKDPDYLLYYTATYSRSLPRNTLNWRTSAHYIEISRIYTFEMMKKAVKLESQYWEEHERNKALKAAAEAAQ
jgi:hypothetical protein